MLKILIVDDETPIREWIEFCIKKNSERYEIVGLASNGMEALEIFQSTMADIVFVDIKMPVMDGMELMKRIKSLKPATEVIVLTAYNDFEYARSAIKYGALEYVLKTEINDQMIREILIKASQKFNNQRENNNTLDTIHWKRESFFRQLIAQNVATVAITEKELEEQHIFLKNSYLFAVAMKYGRVNQQTNFGKECVIPNSEKIQNIFGFIYDQNTFVLIANIKDSYSLAEQINILAKFILELRENYRCTLGVSNIQDGLKYIPKVVKEAVCQSELEFYNGEGSINQMGAAVDVTALLKQLEVKQNSLQEDLRQNGVSVIEESLNQFFSFIYAHKISDVSRVKNLCSQVIEFILDYIESTRGRKINSLSNINGEIAKLGSFQALQSYVMLLMQDVLGNERNRDYSYSITKAVDYIQQHYTEPINLTKVASTVHLNSEYFCRLFKEEIGRNFSTYLANLRLKKAVELLKNSNHTVSEIAEMVGYSNLSYFSTLFKKYYGTSPFDFRNKNI